MNVPYPTASLAVLEIFSRLANVKVDTAELKHEAKKIEAHLSQALDHIKKLAQSEEGIPEAFETYMPDPAENGKLTPEEKDQIEALFFAAQRDRTAAFDLKKELDRLGVFREYEDRFLDLFKGEDAFSGDSTEENLADENPESNTESDD